MRIHNDPVENRRTAEQSSGLSIRYRMCVDVLPSPYPLVTAAAAAVSPPRGDGGPSSFDRAEDFGSPTKRAH